jgi:hypothetical protein
MGNPFRAGASRELYVTIRLNGKVIEHAMETREGRSIPMWIVQRIMAEDIDAASFSSCEIRISKRPITEDKELDMISDALARTVEEEGLEVLTEEDDHPSWPGIKGWEIMELNQTDPLWKKVAMYGTKWSTVTDMEWPEVKRQFKAKFEHTKFYVIHEHKM